MAKKLTPHFASSKAPWISGSSTKLNDAAHTIASKLLKTHTNGSSTKLSDPQKKELETLIKNAEQGRSGAEKFMRSLNKAIDKKFLEAAVIIAPMKSLERASKKFSDAGRNMSDLGRGRIVVKSPKEMEKLYAILAQRDRDKFLENYSQNVTIATGSFSDYLGEPRRSGYAGSINFDLEIDNGKGRKGKFEVQIVPEAYLETCDQSHKIYEIIRAIEENNEWNNSDECQAIRYALVMANTAMFDEFAIRTGFDRFRRAPMQKISEEDWRETMDVLEIMRSAIETLPGRSKPWQKKTMDALTFAKTSVTNMYFAGLRAKPQTAANTRPTRGENGTGEYITALDA
jgi:hypothetical protein